MYDILIKPFVRKMNMERASAVAMRYYKILGRIPLTRQISRILHGNKPEGLEKEVFGLQFYNPVGLGAGLDKRGDVFDELEDLGFSFVEIGPLDAAATRHAIKNIQQKPHSDILAACIDKDFQTSFSLAYDFCDMFVIEISDADDFRRILDPILDCRMTYDFYKPVILKLPENATDTQTQACVDYCRLSGVDGIQARSLHQIRHIARISQKRFPIIANCHIKSVDEAMRALDAGATLIEVRSGIVRHGPWFIRRILKHMSAARATR